MWGEICPASGVRLCKTFPTWYVFSVDGLQTPSPERQNITRGDINGFSSVDWFIFRYAVPGCSDCVRSVHFFHAIEGLTPMLVIREEAKNAAPFYLLNGTTLLNDVKAGQSVTLEDVDLSGRSVYELYLKGLEL